MTSALVLFAIALSAASGVPGAFLRRTSGAGERIAAILMTLGSAAGLAGAFAMIASARTELVSAPWSVPGGELAIRFDAIAGMFLAQIFLIAPLVSIYGLEYWPQAAHPGNGRKLRLFHGLLTASMGVLVIAHNAILFLMGWEGMALAAFLVLTTDDLDPEVRASGFLYFVATRIGTLSLFAMFAVLHAATGAWAFSAAQPIAAPLATAIFLLGLLGCSLKAGIMPMHVWLPGAHANAPSHVSAFMSGVLIKMGIYGLVRVCALFAVPPFWWGALLFGLGIASAVLGVAFALGQHDLKRLLAYHSVENIGIIVMGLGLAVIGRSVGRPELVVLGLSGALLHVWNHGLFKALLFFSAGSVVHATHTREIDSLGGLGKRMPRASLAFLVGAIAICGLPPLNGFVSELFVYLGLLRATLLESSAGSIAAFGVPALALVGALAVACFVKVWTAVFLGVPRSDHGKDAADGGRAMTLPLIVLGVSCAFIGLAPAVIAPVLDHATVAWGMPDAAPAVASLAPLRWLSATGGALVLAVAAGVVLVSRRTRASEVSAAVTWDCGYAAPSRRMQYTASSFADGLVGLFAWALRPRIHGVKLATLFPRAERFESHVPDTVLDRAVLPAADRIARSLVWFRWVQHGKLQLYLLYIVVALIVTVLLRR